jgi:hypothetical protein
MSQKMVPKWTYYKIQKEQFSYSFSASISKDTRAIAGYLVVYLKLRQMVK